MVAASLRCVAAGLLLHIAASQDYPFCLDGIARPELSGDSPVDVIYAQAPLFSTSKFYGNKLARINLFHTTLLFAQGEGPSRRYWTLEYDFMGGNVLTGIVPDIVENGNSTDLVWRNAARYCLTEGLLWGRAHWSKRFDVLLSITADDVRRAFDEFLVPLNSTDISRGPQYQLWRVARMGFFGEARETFLNDITCLQGAVWFLNYLVTALKAKPLMDLDLKGTVTWVYASGMVPVDTSDPVQWNRIVHFYKAFSGFLGVHSSKSSIFHRLLSAGDILWHRRYSYDSNTGVYYQTFGSHIPWLHFGYSKVPLSGPHYDDGERPLERLNFGTQGKSAWITI